MLKVGVTGGIGSGKTVICRVFSTLGVPVYNADDEARRIMNENRKVKDKLVEVFGKGIIRDGRVDRKALAELVFNDTVALRKINEIVHPAVGDDFKAWLGKNKNAPYIVKEAAILFETGTYTGLDTVILVTAPVETRLQRVRERDGDSDDNINRRMENQWTDEKKALLAGIILENDNTRAVLPVILFLHSEYTRGVIPGRVTV